MKITGIASDNAPNRNFGRFSKDELVSIAALLPGVPFSVNHSEAYESKRGMVTKAWLEQGTIEQMSDAIKKEGYWLVKFEAEVDGVNPSIADGVSISTLYRKEKCADCDCDVQNWMACPRPMEKIEAAGYVERVGVNDVLEISFVLIPAVRGAKVTAIGTEKQSDSFSSDNIESVVTVDDVTDNSIGEFPVIETPKAVDSSTAIKTKPSRFHSKDVVVPGTMSSRDSIVVSVPVESAVPVGETETETEKLDVELGQESDDEPEATPPGVILTSEELELLVESQRKLMSELEDMKLKLSEQEQQSQAQVEEAKAQTEKARRDAVLAQQRAKEAELKTRLGISMPYTNTIALPTSSDKVTGQGALKDWLGIVNSADTRQVVYGRGERMEVQRDDALVFQFWRENKQQLRKQIEAAAKSDGFLIGRRDAATAKTDIAPYLLDHLSMMMRTTHQARRVWWQFPVTVDDFTKGPGDVVQVPRWSYLTEPSSETDFTLVPGTDLNTSLQKITATEVPLTLEEKGIGKAGVSGQEPVGIPEFWMARSLENLETKVMMLLGQHYEVCVDLMIRTQYRTTLGVLYNDNGNVTATPADLTAGDDGTLTQDFAHSVFAYLSGEKVPTLADGNYAWVVHSKAAGQLRRNLGDQLRPVTRMDLEEATNLLPVTAMQGQVTGYLGNYCNFHFFETNAHSLGAAGTEGSQNATLGVGSTLTRSSYVFGLAAVGRGIGMAPQIRRDTNDNYGRLGKFVWLSHEACGTLDVDPNNDASEQRRVWEVRTVDTPI